MQRCDELIVQLVIRTYNEDGQPVREVLSRPAKVFRATAPDLWRDIDATVAEMNKATMELSEGH
jgi:hypothetical protein